MHHSSINIASTWSMDFNLSERSKTGKQLITSQTSKTRSNIGSDDMFKLFCWVLNWSNKPFSVDIRKSKMVGHLKDMIKKKLENTLVGIVANTLDIWKVNISS
jgi:Crinkler effector protein N-terminal domain